MDRKKHRIFWGCLAAAILTAIAVFFACFQITSVKVEGNKNYTEDEIKKMVLSGPLSGNSVLVRFLDPDKRTKDAEFINKVWLERTSPVSYTHPARLIASTGAISRGTPGLITTRSRAAGIP